MKTFVLDYNGLWLNNIVMKYNLRKIFNRDIVMDGT